MEKHQVQIYETVLLTDKLNVTTLILNYYFSCRCGCS